jgi:cation:H+ antiporter
MLNAILLVAGLALLTVGGESIIRGALAAATRLKISPLLAGLVIVGFGTSAPELVVTVDAVLTNRADIAIGNIVGSNISNIMLILGLCSIITPLTVQRLSLQRDGLTGVGGAILFVLLTGSAILTRVDALILLSVLTAYLVFAYRSERALEDPTAPSTLAQLDEIVALPVSSRLTWLYLIGGGLLLAAGARLLLLGAVGIAEAFNVPDAVIGLTLVAVGTSLPELAVSLLAALRRHADLAVGNILGSNIFNLFAVLGIAALLQPLPVAARIVQFDQWIMLGASIILMLILYTGLRINRWEGAALLSAYGIYIWLSFTRFLS